MAEHIIVDPITRIEGHLRIEAIIDDNGVISPLMQVVQCLEELRQF